ncbi:MAG: hypothetical protein P8J87_19790, partial [Verrucomicrobiales bacterium]|nr:hypothetical protein [Verrucomicrobiales bacterium]
GATAAADVIGVWTGGGLSNSGEKVTLLDANGLVVFATDYSDSGDWPDAADDDGASLVLVDGASDPASPSSWVASAVAGGSPGGRDGESLEDWQARTGEADLLADTDGNGVNALLTYALGVDLAAGGLEEALPVVGTTEVGGKTYATLTFRRRIGSVAEGFSYAVEIAQGLSGWSSAAGSTVEVGNPDYVGDGTEAITVRSAVALEDGLDAAQMRLRVSVN